jgi:hypothetical protein
MIWFLNILNKNLSIFKIEISKYELYFNSLMVKEKVFPLGFLDKEIVGGTHMVFLYDSEQDLYDILPLFFARGLTNKELCLVIYPDEEKKEKIEKEISKMVPLDKYKDKLEFIDYKIFYTDAKKLRVDKNNTFHILHNKLKSIDYQDIDGVRILGDMSWINNQVFNDLIDVEKELTEKYFKKNLLMICSYPLKKLSAAEIIEIIQSHNVVLYRKNNQWVLSETVERKRMDAEIEDIKSFNKMAVDRELKMIELKDKIKELEKNQKIK